MSNICLVLSFDGGAYHGWQSQKNALSVQEILKNSITAVTGEAPVFHGCGRTDAGVHAAVYTASFESGTNIPLDKLPLALNSNLPEDVAVSAALAVNDNFNARFSCVKKQYTYTVYNGKTRDPLSRSTALFYPAALDLAAMKECAREFTGEHDFAGFRSLGTPVSSTVREMYQCEIKENGAFLQIEMTANGFLYNMARTVAGTLLNAGIGKTDAGRIREILKSGERSNVCVTAPAHGLCLTRLWYDKKDIDAAGCGTRRISNE